jgi:hypothetical protein
MTYPSPAGWQDICHNNYRRTRHQEVHCEVVCLGVSAAATPQRTKVAWQGNGVTAVLNHQPVQAQS